MFGSIILIESLDLPSELVSVLLWIPLQFGALILLAVEAWRKRVQSLKFAVPPMAVYLVILSLILVGQLDPGFDWSLDSVLVLCMALGLGIVLLAALWWKARRRSVLVMAPIVGLIIMACAPAWLAIYTNYMTPAYERRSAPRQAVLVARSPIAAGSVIRIDMVTLQERDNVPPGAATQPRDVEGLTALRNIAQGEVILLQELSAPRLEGAGPRPEPTWTPTPTPTSRSRSILRSTTWRRALRARLRAAPGAGSRRARSRERWPWPGQIVRC